MQVQRFEIFFENEIPKIKCGLRRVEAEVGRDWVYVRLPSRPKRIRVRRDVFFALAPRELTGSAQ